jgi:hypothetical protein
MSYRPLSPGKTERTGSSRDRQYELLVDLDFDTPFVPVAFPCYTPTVCAEPLPNNLIFPALVVDDQGDQVVTDNGDTVIAVNED